LNGLTGHELLNNTKSVIGDCKENATNKTNTTAVGVFKNYTKSNHSVNSTDRSRADTISNTTGEKRYGNITKTDTNSTTVCPGFNLTYPSNDTNDTNSTSEVQLKSAVKT
jgi:hypothetical protein